jgi:hypothetical protein
VTAAMQGLPKFEMSDDEWQGLCSHIALPAEARTQIDIFIALYRAFEEGMKSHSLLDANSRIENAAIALRKALDQIEAFPPEAMYALFRPSYSRPEGGLGHPPINPTDLFLRYIEYVSNIGKLETWLLAAVERVPPKTPSNDKSNNVWLVEQLGVMLLRFTGKGISRSSKRNNVSREFVGTALRIACPSIGLGSIDEAMKDAINRRGRRAPEVVVD